MSRHQVPLRPGISAESAWIGWDRPLQTFFAQVLAQPNEEGEQKEILWIGTSLGEIHKASDAARALEPYCEIDEGLVARLEIDRMKTLATIDGPNQAEAKAFIERLAERRGGDGDEV